LARKFNFDLFRLNIVDLEDLFLPDQSSLIRGDEDIFRLIEASCDSKFDKDQETSNAKFRWSLRYFTDYTSTNHDRSFLSVVIARSVLEKGGLIVTDDGIDEGSSMSNPPLASTMILFFDLQRHLVAVEHSGELSQVLWKDHLEKIIDDVALNLGKASTVKLEPVPEKHEIVGLFKSFDKVTRIKATLRIPNPELTRYTQSLFDDLKSSDVREYTQDMKNPGGLSKKEDARPFATAVLAQQGYKSGDVQIEGYRNQTFERVLSGANASRGAINSLKQFVRGLGANAKAKETQKVLQEIAKEIDRIHPIDPQAGNE
jgi:hypothetical protein